MKPSEIDEYLALVVSEGAMGDGGVMRVLLVRPGEYDAAEVADLAEYGNQHITEIDLDVCDTAAAARAVFDEMNPPDEGDEDDEDEEDVGTEHTCARCGRPFVFDRNGVACHLTDTGDTDFDRDADHVPVDDRKYGRR